jgi:hypothetical protein
MKYSLLIMPGTLISSFLTFKVVSSTNESGDDKLL